MIIIMKKNAGLEAVERVSTKVKALAFQTHVSQGEERTILGIIGDERPLQANRHVFELMEGVERAVPILRPYKLASRDFQPQDTVISLNGLTIGDRTVVVMAGPCAVESREQLMETALAVKEAGVHILRGGAFKPRTSPYSFQGLGESGLELLAEARELTGLAIITEVMAPEQVPLVSKYADILQVGTRNMSNYSLLHAVGEAGKPVLLKRGMMSTVEELLMSAEYILSHGNYQVMLCERGIRTFEPQTRFSLDINAVPLLKELTHLPVIVDPSHGTGKSELVSPISRAAVAAGADGLIVEVHAHPEQAESDGAQSLKPVRFAELMRELRRIAAAVDREL